MSRCRCPTNEAGDIRCHMCGEYVNVKCWNCGTPRGDGPCPNDPDQLSNAALYGACQLHNPPVPRTFQLDRELDPAGNLASETYSIICPACTAAANESRAGDVDPIFPAAALAEHDHLPEQP